MIEEKFMVFRLIKYQFEYGKTYIFNQFLDFSAQSKQKRSNFYQCDDNLEDWDAGKQKVRGANDTAKSINESLRQIRNRIYDKESELLDRGYVLTADLLKDAYLDKIDAIQQKTLCQLYEEYLESLSKAVGTNISDDTYYHYQRTLVLIKEYISQKYRRNDMALQELNYSFISDFDIFLRKDYNQRKNTTVKHLRCLKRVVNVAIANRYLKFDPFLNFKVQREVVDKVFLTEEELRAIINKDFAIKRLERVRDIFIFCCFTGLSYSDVKTLDRSHFETDEAGRVWIKKHRVKTGVLFRVPLLPIPKLILEKYKGGEHLPSSHRPFLHRCLSERNCRFMRN